MKTDAKFLRWGATILVVLLWFYAIVWIFGLQINWFDTEYTKLSIHQKVINLTTVLTIFLPVYYSFLWLVRKVWTIE